MKQIVDGTKIINFKAKYSKMVPVSVLGNWKQF